MEPKEKDPIYFNMNVPNWFMDLSSPEEKCKIVEELVHDLKDEKPITQQQRDKLFLRQ